MFTTKSYILTISLALLTTGCATKYPSADNAVHNIEESKKQQRVQKVSLDTTTATHRQYLAAMTDDNKIDYVCKLSAPDCHLDTENKQYTWILFSTRGFIPNFDITRKAQCGVGSIYGVFALLDEALSIDKKHDHGMGFRNYDKRNEEICNNRFTKVADYQFYERLMYIIPSLGTSILSQGNMHRREFDYDEFQKAINESGLNALSKPYIYALQYKSATGSIYEIIYLDDDYDMNKDLENKLNEKTKFEDYAGAIFVDPKQAKTYAVIRFEDYKSKNYSKALNAMINTIYSGIAKNMEVPISYAELSSQIPQEIQMPTIPEPEKLVKSEYEKRSAFNARVKKTAQKREAMIKSLQATYNDEVAQRNSFIESLEQEYTQRRKESIKKREAFSQIIDKNTETLAHYLFKRYMKGFYASDMNYDAESESLYFTLKSKNGTYTNLVKANVSPHDAQVIKKRGQYDIKPELEYDHNTLYVKGFELKEQDGGSRYDIVYTNKSFEPTYMAVSVAEENEKIIKAKSINFQTYKQTPTDLIAYDKKEIWYIDVANREDAKVPEWFKRLQRTNALFGFGSGNTLDEATDRARASLAKNIKSYVSSVSKLNKEANNQNQLYTQYENKINVQSGLTLGKSDYKLYKQDRVDGKWYVVLEYTN